MEGMVDTPGAVEAAAVLALLVMPVEVIMAAAQGEGEVLVRQVQQHPLKM